MTGFPRKSLADNTACKRLSQTHVLLSASAIALSAAAVAVYSHALWGAFVFDDLYLPFSDPLANRLSLLAWIKGVRSVVMFTYWLNYHFAGLVPFYYHAVNLALHVVASGLVFLIGRQLLKHAGPGSAPAEPLALFAAALFLLHPVQTEAVSYIAARSEEVCAVFVYTALLLFLSGRDTGLTVSRSLSIFTLFALACLSKEHAVAFPIVCAMTEVILPAESPEVRQRNRRFCVALWGLGALMIVLLEKTVLQHATSVGFGLRGVSWREYLLTESRAVWVYLRLFFLPLRQNADYDFRISRTILDGGVILSIIGVGVLAAAAVLLRRRRPLLSYGFLVFLALLAPTSSFVPIADPIAERRLYVPSLGLLVALMGILHRWSFSRRFHPVALVLVVAAAAGLTYRRNGVWSSPLALWQDTVQKSPRKYRPHFQLAYAYTYAGRCEDGIHEFETAARLGPRDYAFLVDSALAYECAGRVEEALAALSEAAAAYRSAHVYTQIGVIYAKRGRNVEALAAFREAESIDPEFELTYVCRGIMYARLGQPLQAAADFRKALALNPDDQTAAAALRFAEQQSSAEH